MQRSRAVVLTLIAAVIFGLLASVAIYNYLKQQQMETQRARGEQQNVVVAAMDIPAGASLSPEQVRAVMWPKTSLPPGAIYDPALAVGRLAVRDLVVGEPVLDSKLAPKDVTTGVMTFLIPPGKRAVTVGVDPVTGVSGFILPNSHVDVIVTVQTKAGMKVSRTALQNIRVLAVGEIMDQKEGKPVAVPTVTLAVSPEEAEMLSLGRSEGQLQLVLRKFGDQEEVSTRGVTLNRLLLSSEAPAQRSAPVVRAKRSVPLEAAPAPPKTSTRSVEIIRSTKGGVQKTDERFIQNSEGIWEKK